MGVVVDEIEVEVEVEIAEVVMKVAKGGVS